MAIADTFRSVVARFRGAPVIANQYPSWETTTPQYTLPTPKNLADVGYTRNELVFACIDELATSFSEPPIKAFTTPDPKTRKELPEHPIQALLDSPNPYLSGEEFRRISEIYLDVAGFAAWEIEVNNLDEPIALWPMRPDFCSFLRGAGKPIRAIRYAPYGMTHEDIPIERVLLISEFDPRSPMLKPLSRTAVALRVVDVDNGMTDFLKIFFQNGAFVAGVLKTEQSLTEAEAERIKARWQQQYGGVRNWVLPAVLGKGVSYERTTQTFREMEADVLDARNEARICMVFRVSPILISAKLGMGTITENNYKEARAAMYERVITPKWRMFGAQVYRQLKPYYPDEFTLLFDTRDVKALQEDRSAIWERARGAWTDNLITRNQALVEMGVDTLKPDLGDVYYGEVVTVVRESVTGTQQDGQTADEPQGDAVAQAEQVAADAQAKQDEAKRARTFFKNRIKEGKAVSVSDFQWKHNDADEQRQIAVKAGALMETLPAVIPALPAETETRINAALQRFEDAMKTEVSVQPQIIYVYPPKLDMPPMVNNLTVQAGETVVEIIKADAPKTETTTLHYDGDKVLGMTKVRE